MHMPCCPALTPQCPDFEAINSLDEELQPFKRQYHICFPVCVCVKMADSKSEVQSMMFPVCVNG